MEKTPSMEATREQATTRLVIGLTLIVVGVLFALDRMGFVVARDFIRYWPLAVVVLGLLKLLQARAGSERVGAVVLVAVGGLLLASSLGYLHFSVFDLWPLLLVIVGWRLAKRGLRGRASAEDEPEVSALAVMGSLKRSNRSLRFAGGDLTAVMGGCEIDLTAAEMAGDEAVLDLFAFWGGIDIRVPEDWTVVNRVQALLGAVEDKTGHPPAAEGKRLVLTGWALMGGVEVSR